MHLDRIIKGEMPRTGSSGAEHEREATNPWKVASREEGPKAKEEWQENAGRQEGEEGVEQRCTWPRSSRGRLPGLDHPGWSMKERPQP